MPPTRPQCAAAHCQIRNRHNPDCADTSRCWGCLIRPAADGLNLCLVDTARLQTDAARCAILHRDLELVLLSAGATGDHIATTGGGPPVPRDEVMAARARITFILEKITKLIVDQRGVTPPTEPHLVPLADGAEGPQRLVRRISTHPPTLARFVARHREWLAAHRHAAKVADALREMAGDGQLWGLAYPSGSSRLYIGDCPCPVEEADGSEGICGTRLYQMPDQPLIGCAGCGVEETVERWQRWIVGETAAHVDSIALAGHLALTWMRPVDPALIRQWAHRGKIAPVMEPDPTDPARERPLRDRKHRVLYDLTAVVAYVHTVWGEPARLRRKAS